MTDIKDELLTLFSKIWTWVCLILLGMVGMFSHNLYVGRKMTFREAIGSFGVSFFVGVLTSLLCYLQEWDKAGVWIVPFATLLSDKIMMAILALDWDKNIKEWIVDFLKGVISKLKGK
jgi:hypothetical protein